MEIWFGAARLRSHREPGATPSTGAKPHTSLHPGLQTHDEEEAKSASFLSGAQHDMRALRWKRHWLCRLLLTPHFCHFVRSYDSSDSSLHNPGRCSPCLGLAAVRWQMRLMTDSFCPTIRRPLIDKGEGGKMSKEGVC